MKIYGFTYVRNGETLGYPYLEAIRCLSELCDAVYVAVGDSTDCTRELVAAVPAVHVIDTIWDDALRQGGKIFSIQANTALRELRKNHSEGWALHLQADQIVLRDDFAQIRADFERAEASGCDALAMRFLHFWHTPRAIAYSKRWFPQTVVAARVGSKVESVGDSQSLGGYSKLFESDVNVFHYGHALGDKFYEQKQRTLHRWWHPDSAIDTVMKKSAGKDREEPSLPYLGPHPVWMQSRLGSPLEKVERCWIVGELPDEFRSRIGAREVRVVASLTEVPSEARTEAVILDPSWWQRLLYPTKVPSAMLWPQARSFPQDLWLTLKLAEKGVPVDLSRG